MQNFLVSKISRAITFQTKRVNCFCDENAPQVPKQLLRHKCAKSACNVGSLISKHLQGQFGPRVSNETFLIMDVVWGPVIVTSRFHGFLWFQVGFYGFSWFQVGFHGFSWFQVGFHGSRSVFMVPGWFFIFRPKTVFWPDNSVQALSAVGRLWPS